MLRKINAKANTLDTLYYFMKCVIGKCIAFINRRKVKTEYDDDKYDISTLNVGSSISD